ncbi:MAG: alanine racemase [Acidobacteria bacterium]|nr:MAG: alanine racemase [Acidobacteriota bacterium]
MKSRNWVEISRGALRRNLAYVRQLLPPATAICAVVKADAYGHGAVACAEVFAAAGVEWLAVTSVEEGVKLRHAGLQPRILVLGGFEAEDAADLLQHHLTPAVWDAAQVRWLGAAMNGHRAGIHLKLETGMGRLGVTAAQEAEVAAALHAAPGVQVEAVFSHLASADSPDGHPSEQQHERLLAEAAAHHFTATSPAWHLLNSEAALRFPQWGGAMARVGLALYGYSAQPEHAQRLQPALTWKTRVVGVKELPAGHGIGYGARFHTPHTMRVATLAAGYADGYRREFFPGAQVALGGAPAPVVGAVSMDLTTVDASAAPQLALGDTATLLGAGAPDAAGLAQLAHTIPYEILCGISARVERIYVD